VRYISFTKNYSMKTQLLVFKLFVATAACFSLAESVQAGGYRSCGMASYYNSGDITASGEQFRPGAMTAAHPWLPFNSYITVVDQNTGRSARVRINDRGPWADGRIIDLTPTAMNAIDPRQTADVRYVCLH
jgi:rare lipoprotein A (peptidoglycan hydrolase)